MSIEIHEKEVDQPDSVFITLSVLKDFAKQNGDSSASDEIIVDKSCNKVSSLYIRGKFRSIVEALSSTFGILAERAETVLEENGIEGEVTDEILDSIFNVDAVSNEIDTELPVDFESTIQETKERAADWTAEELPRALSQISYIVKRVSRQINTELDSQFDWREFNFPAETNELFNGQVEDDIVAHTYKSVFHWPEFPSIWYVIVGENPEMDEIPSSIREIFEEENHPYMRFRIIQCDKIQA
ncbi:hypothetical protein [Haloarcula argentinensis]|uniref:hypothetical protein n=1 Tax=Haloarcula argentinensis TaxID=43776 RepID=UPI0002B116CF|nr:hypothetical protein [Haloarcula argentinensis]EMA25652.1 hypothetical protein C443_02544 [Haloarcula argentinensis DSM 12282]